MYELAKKARSGMKSKAERLAGEKDRKTDSSDWSPAEPLNADVKTGMRPVSRRAYKSGGKVAGCATPARADRKARKAGGKVEEKGEQPMVDRYVNRDLKKANEYRDGKKHVGALKHGGRAKKANGGMTMEEMIAKNPAPAKKPLGLDKIPLPPRRPTNLTPAVNNKIKPDQTKYMTGDDITGPPKKVRKDGGRAKKQDGGPMQMDPRLGIVKPKAMEFGQNLVTPGLKSGGRAKKQVGGGAATAAGMAATQALAPVQVAAPKPANVPTQTPAAPAPAATPQTPATQPNSPASSAPRSEQATNRLASIRERMEAMRQRFRDRIAARPNTRFGAAQAKKGGRIAKQVGGALGMSANGMMPQLPPQAMGAAQGVPMQSGAMMPPGMANRPSMPTAMPVAAPLTRASGGRAKGKGKTHINIVIATGGKQQPQSMVPTPPETPMGPQGVPIPVPPATPPMGAGSVPPAAMFGAPPPPAGGPQMPPMPMPRKAGGRVSKVAHSYKDMTAGSGSGEGRLQKTDIAKRAPHKAGGKVYRSYKDMDAGAGSGEGRLEKTEIQKRKK